MQGIEMGCGKGRNVLWLGQKLWVSTMYGFDFSAIAIEEAKRRALLQGLSQKVKFHVGDATLPWLYPSDSMDFAIDCTASTDIECPQKRQYATREMHRVVRKGGYILTYVMSTDDEYHRMLIRQSPAEEEHACIHPKTGKFEKVFSGTELDSLYAAFTLVEERRIEKTCEFFGVSYKCRHHWRVYQK